MVTLRGNLTDPPKVSTSDVPGTLKGWAGYILILGMAFAAFGIARATVQPTVEGLASMLPGVKPGGGSSGPWSGW